MAVEGRYLYAADESHIVAAGTLASGQVIQLPDGRAGVVSGAGVAPAANDRVNIITKGVVRLAKTASQVILPGGCVYWDRSANKATVIPVLAQNDFYIGIVQGIGSVASSTTVDVELNALPAGIRIGGTGQAWTWDVDGTSGGLAPASPLATIDGTVARLFIGTTSETQMAAVYPLDTLPIAQTPIFEALIHTVSWTSSALDLNVGLATGGHDTDFTSVTEYMTVQLDGGNSAINVTSEDGTTTTTPDDSTADYTDGTMFHVAIDCRTLSACKVYINGVADASGADLALDDGSGPWLPIAHAEKSTGVETGQVLIPFMNLRPGVL